MQTVSESHTTFLPPKRLRLKMTSKRQVTLPVEATRYLDISSDHMLELVFDKGKVYLESAPMTLEETYGSVKSPYPAAQTLKMEHEAKDEHAQKVMRKLNAT